MPQLVCVLFALLAASWGSALAQELPDTLVPVGGVLIVGEIHGTEQVPAAVGHLAEQLALAGHPLVVGLELPADRTPSLQKLVDGELEAARVAAGWQGAADGRTSQAVLKLVEQLAGVASRGHPVDVFAFDDLVLSADRERAMADVIARHVGPDTVVLVLTGSRHARKTDDEPRMASLLAQRGIDVRAVDLVTWGGWYWNCLGGRCGVFRIEGTVDGDVPRIEVLDQPDAHGFVARLHVGTVTPSPPANEQARARFADVEIPASLGGPDAVSSYAPGPRCSERVDERLLAARDGSGRAPGAARIERWAGHLRVCTPQAHYAAASLLLSEGDDAGHYHAAYLMARYAAEGGMPVARVMAATSWDRWRVATGMPQFFGTQLRVQQDGSICLVPVATTSTDADRARWDTPSLQERMGQVLALNRRTDLLPRMSVLEQAGLLCAMP